MSFDARRYEDEVIRPLRRRHELSGLELSHRYGVRPSMTDGEIVDQLRSVRSYWDRMVRAAGTHLGSVCSKLIEADRELREANGPAMDEPHWWRDYFRKQSSESTADALARTEDDAPSAIVDLDLDLDTVSDVSGVAVFGPTGPQASARLAAMRQQARKDSAGIHDRERRLNSVPRNERNSSVPPPRGPTDEASLGARPDDLGLTVNPISAVGTVVWVRLSWRDPGAGEVVIRRTEAETRLSHGQAIEAASVCRFGFDVTGEVTVDGEWRSMVVEVATGYHVYVPFVAGNGTATVGRSVSLVVAAPVQRLKVRRTGPHVSVTWEWKADVRLADVEWTVAGRKESRRVSRDEYRDHGLTLSGDSETTIVVRTVEIMPDQTEAYSSSEERVAAARPVNLRWRLVRRRTLRPARSVRYLVEVMADRACEQVGLVFVSDTGLAMPAAPSPANVRRRLVDLTFEAGEARRFEFDVAANLHRRQTYWIRCFAEPRDSVGVIDPPVTNMKVD